MELINPYRVFQGSFIGNWLLERTEVSANAKLVYARLCQHANKKTGCAWPRIETVAAGVGLSVRTTERAVHELKELELIQVVRRGLCRSNKYYFAKHQWMYEAPSIRIVYRWD